MTRWQPDTRHRLERAALDLFTQQGFAETTVPEITARAGLTTRTFFRHFADKREVLFAGDEIPQLATQLMAAAPASLDAGTVILEGLRTVAETRFEGRRQEVRQWRGIVRTDDGLRERDLRKRAALCEAIRLGFVGRGTDATTSILLAEISVILLHVSLDRWLDQAGERTLFQTILETLGSLQTSLVSFPTEVPPATETA